VKPKKLERRTQGVARTPGIAAALAAVTAPLLAQAPPPATPPACSWTLTASSPVAMVHQGVSATYIESGGELIVMLGGVRGQSVGGTIMVSGVTGTGVYDVTGGAPGGSNSGSVLMAERHDGSIVPLASGSGGDLIHQNRVVGKYPPPSRLTINHYSATEIRGDLSGTYYDMMAVGGTSPAIVPVPVHVVFSAAPAWAPVACP